LSGYISQVTLVSSTFPLILLIFHILAVLSRLVASSERLLLRYDRAEDAVKLLRERFSDWSSQSGDLKKDDTLPGRQAHVVQQLSPGSYQRKPDISIIQIEDQVFLADEQGAAIHHLNPVGAAIWSLLAEPVTAAEMTKLLMSAFPDHEPGRIEGDLGNLIGELLKKNLLLAGS
jgi:hypothetical protein